MELFIFRHGEFLHEYNCSKIRIENVPLERRQNLFNGMLMLILTMVSELLYIPCLVSIWRRCKGNSCYKMLFFIGLMDIAELCICGIASGIFSMLGTVFCSYPRLIYILGCFAMALWAAESITGLALAINRCLEMSHPIFAEKMFKDHRTTLWLLFASAYAICWLFFTKPALFCGIYGAWFFNPFEGYIDDEKYQNYWHSIHDATMAISFPLVYLFFAINIWLWRGNQNVEMERTVSQNRVVIISFVNFYACVLYVFMQYVSVNQLVIYLAQYGWILIHATPPYVYLTMNKSIQQDLRNLFKFNKNRTAAIATTILDGVRGVMALHDRTEANQRQNDGLQRLRQMTASIRPIARTI